MSWKSLFSGGKKDVAPVAPAAVSPPFAFGKLGTRRDFVHLGRTSAPAFERWLEEGLEAARSRGGGFPAGPLAFALPQLGNGASLIGMMVPSSDAAGRSFPLAIARVCANGPSRALCDWWYAQTDFLVHAARVLADAETGGEEVLLSHLENWPDAAAAADPPAEIAHDSPALPVIEEMFGPVAGNGPGYALATFCAACEAARKMGPDSAGISVEAPAPDPASVGLWLALAGRKLGWERGRPALLATGDRLVIGLGQGAPAPGLLTAYCVGAKAGARHWTLTTEDGSVRARSVLPARAQAVLANDDGTVGDLVAALA